jgi:drug/metabolite transporter (DMT)-like permease
MASPRLRPGSGCCYNRPMKASLILGLVLIAAGIFLIVRPLHYASEQSVFKIGDVEARMQQERALPGWVGGLVLGAGIVLLGTGLIKK